MKLHNKEGREKRATLGVSKKGRGGEGGAREGRDHINAAEFTGAGKCLSVQDGQSLDFSLSVNSAASDASDALASLNVLNDAKVQYASPPEKLPIKILLGGNQGAAFTNALGTQAIHHINFSQLARVGECLGGRDGQSLDLSLSVNSPASFASDVLEALLGHALRSATSFAGTVSIFVVIRQP